MNIFRAITLIIYFMICFPSSDNANAFLVVLGINLLWEICDAVEKIRS